MADDTSGLGIKPEIYSDVYDAISPTKLTGSFFFLDREGRFLLQVQVRDKEFNYGVS